ncbi:MAG: DNA polymerase III subunit delta' [Gammaproteobacteria bacterium]
MSAPYPWLEEAWRELVDRARRDALGHAYLLAGREGLGKLALAEALAHALLCEARPADGAACGSCRGCALLASGNHPDLRRVSPEEDKKSIPVDQIRELIEFFTLKSHYQGRKVGIVHPADLMNTNAANALLKLLEEPPGTALLLLVANRPALLPATVLSRCQRVDLALPAWEVRERWLIEQLAGRDNAPALGELSLCGAPLEVLTQLDSARPALADDLIAALGAGLAGRLGPLEAAKSFADVDVRRLLDTLELCLQAAAQLCAGHAPRQLRLIDRSLRQLQEIADKLHFEGLLAFLDRVAESRGLVLRSSGVRGAEVIENLWQAWLKSTHRETAS